MKRRRSKLPNKLSVPSFFDPPPPVESVRVEFSMDANGHGRMKLIVVCPNGYVFTDETDIDTEVVEWRFEEGVTA